MPDAQILKEPGASVTFKATAAVTGKRFLKITGNRTGGGMGGLSTDLANVYQMAQAVADDNAVGVSAQDVANGALGRCIGGGIVTVESGAAVAAGAIVKADAQGRAITWATAGAVLGVAMNGVGAAGADLEVKLRT
jgi:hypothetical protein